MGMDTPLRVEVTSGFSSKARQKFPATGVWVATFVALSGTWHTGFSIGSVNAAYTPIVSFIETEYEDRYGRNISSEFVNGMWVATSAIFPVGGLFGSLCVGSLVARFGRLKSILWSHILIVLMSTLLGLTKVFGFPELMLIARFGLGLTSGAMATGISAMYVAEVSPKNLRGILCGLVGTGINVGVFLSSCLGVPAILSNDTGWPILLALTGVPSVLFVLIYKKLPESPRELFMEKGNHKKAIQVLINLNGTDDVSNILDEMAQEKEKARSLKQLSTLQVLQSRRFAPAVITATILACAQQLSGINGIAFNLNNAFLTAGLSYKVVPYATIGVTGLMVLLSFVSLVMVEKFGRKFMIYLGYTIEAVSLITITIFIQLQNLSDIFPYLTVVASMGFYCGFSLGPAIVTHVVIPELFDQVSRSAGIVISSTCLWISFTTCVVATPYLLASISGYTFLFFCGFAVATVIFTYLKVPETKNMTFHDVKEELTNKFSFTPAI